MYFQEKADALVQTRVKTTTLATVARYFAVHGMIQMSKSSLMRVVLEEFEKVLLQNKLTERVTNILDAREILGKLGLENFNPGGRMGRNYMEELQREVYDFEGWDPAELDTRRTKTSIKKELDSITNDPMQMQQVLDDAQAITERTRKQQERSTEEHTELGNTEGVEVVEE